MVNGFRKIALIATVLLGALRLHWLFEQATYTFRDDSPGLVALIGNALLLIPLPVLIFLVYRTRATPVLPSRLGYLAVAVGLADGVFSLRSVIPRLIREFRYIPDFEYFRRETIAAQLWIWLR